MDEPFLTYTLSFISRRGKRPPELRITLRDAILRKAEHLLRTSRILELAGLNEYLQDDYADPWREPELNLHKSAFGIHDCGYVTSLDGMSNIHFPYVPKNEYRIAMTLHVLFVALDWGAEENETLSNQKQLCSIRTGCEYRSMGWGHMVGGDIYPTFRRWLATISPELRERVEQKMGNAVITAYSALAEPAKRKEIRTLWKPECYGRIHSSGRFMINCPGNACDIAIYPDCDSHSEEYEYCLFSCHNLDSAVQQLSLLAGFAALCEEAQKDLET